MRSTITALAVVLLGLTNPVWSQNEPSPNLDSLIAIAFRNNPDVEMARYEALAARQRIRPAGTLPDPELRVGAMNVPTSFSLTSEEMTMAPQVSLMQMFPWFGKLGAASEVQRYNYQSAEDRLASARLDVQTSLRKVYGETYRVEKSLEYLQWKKQLLQGVVKVAEQLFAVGQVPQQDVFRATAELTMVRSDILMEQSMLQDLRAQLGALLGQNAPYVIRVDTLSLLPPDSLAALQSRLGDMNPELKQIKSTVLAANAQAVYARKDAVPDFSVGVSYGYRAALMPDGSKARDMVSLELGVSLPVFYGSKQSSMIDEADLMAQAAKKQYTSVELDLNSRLRSTFAAAQAQKNLIPLYSKELIPQYEATYNASLSAYSVGKTTFAMLIDNLTTLINTKIEYVKIQSDYFSTLAEISRLVGAETKDSGGAQ